jgi:hypothetical protein
MREPAFGGLSSLCADAGYILTKALQLGNLEACGFGRRSLPQWLKLLEERMLPRDVTPPKSCRVADPCRYPQPFKVTG